MGLTRPRAYQIFDIDYKQSVRVLQATNINLSGGAPAIVDSVSLSLNDRVLVVGQSTASQNGLYYVTTVGTGSNGTWTRTIDANQTGEIDAGMIVMVTEGSVYADTQWKLTTNDPIVIGSTALTFVQNYSANSITAGTSNVVVASNSNVSIAVGGSNIVVFSTGTQNITGNIIPTANVTYDLGNATNRFNDLYLANNSIFLGNVTLAATATDLTVNGATVITAAGSSTLSLTGNITGGNLISNAAVIATGNITGGNIIANGRPLTSLNASNIDSGTLSQARLANSTLILGNTTLTLGGTTTTVAGLTSVTSTTFVGALTGAATTAGTVTTAAQPNITSVGTLSSVTVTANVAGGNLTTGGQVVATGNITGGNLTATGCVYGIELWSTQSSGDEGGQLNLGRPASNNTLSGSSVTVDIFQNKFRIFEQGGTVRGAYIDLTACGAGVGTNLLAGGAGGTPGGANTYVQFNDGGLFGGNAQFTYDKVNNSLTVGNVYTSSNGAGTNLRVGDDAWIGDVNQTNTIRITGQQNAANGYLIFGNADSTALGRAGTGPLTYGGAFTATGNISGGNVTTGGNVVATGNVSGGNVAATTTVFSFGTVVGTGNTSGGNLTTGGQVVATGNITGGNLATAGTVTATGNVAGGNLTTGGQVVATGNITGGNLTTVGQVAATGNVAGGNLTTVGQVAATGNITGSFFFGNGSQLTGTGVKFTSQANTPPSSPNNGDFWFETTNDILYQYINDGSSSQWIDQSFPTSFSTIAVGGITNTNANGVGNIGSSVNYFNTVFAKATSAQYADLAEMYVADANYEPGTVVVFGGDYEITLSNQSHDTAVAGIVSTNPSYLMNSTQEGTHVLPIALTGRVPCRVQGPVAKGDVLVTSNIPGTAQRIGFNYQPGCVIGKSLEPIKDTSIQIIEVAVGRF